MREIGHPVMRRRFLKINLMLHLRMRHKTEDIGEEKAWKRL